MNTTEGQPTEPPVFHGGVNIAMKIPPHLYDQTERFYVDTLALPVVSRTDSSVELEFGPNRLWLDRVPTMSQAEIWLEVVADDLASASEHLHRRGVPRCDEIEPLPDGSRAFWITSPAQIVHLVLQPDD